MKIDSEIIEKSNPAYCFFSTENYFLDHRALTIKTVCEIESELCEVLARFFSLRNPEVTVEQVLSDLYGESGMLSTLGRIAKLSYYLGFISIEMLHDLKKLAKS